MYKNLLLVCFSLFFISCSSKNSGFKYFETNTIKSQAVQNTKKSDIVVDNEVNVLFWATYLNKIEKYEDLENEAFLVTLYFTKSDSQDINKNNYKLTLNEKDSLILIDVSKDEKYKDLIVNNKWGKAYLVKFSKDKDSLKLNLDLSNQSTKAQLTFEK